MCVDVLGPMMVQGPVDRVEGACALTKDPVNLGQVELICVFFVKNEYFCSGIIFM